jgi:hypothetical protein
MAAAPGTWDQRLAEVGPGLTARRIFANLGRGPDSQIRKVEEAHRAGLLPVISYQTGGDGPGAAAGRYNAVAAKAADRLQSFGKPAAVVFWHEPHNEPNLSPAQFVQANKQLMPIFKARSQLSTGCFLNGFLLDNLQSTFGTYCPDSLAKGGYWDWMGMDVYQYGTLSTPRTPWPGDRISLLSNYTARRGINLPLAIGEYNGFTYSSIYDCGQKFLGDSRYWLSCMWNSNGERAGAVLSGDRLRAFRQTLADPRAA